MGISWEIPYQYGKSWGYHGNIVQNPSFMGFIPDLSIKYRNYY
jgi:hypothetical protein